MLKSILLFIFFTTLINLSAFADANNSQLTTREQQQQDSQKLKTEINNAAEAAKPNSPSAPTKLQIDTSQIDPNVVFEINNHLFGYSSLFIKDNTYHGVKITGLVNIAFYSPTKENDGTRKKGRFVFGFESPFYELTNGLAFFAGIGATLGDVKGLYLDAGLDYRIFKYLKSQFGLNYNSAGETAPQFSLGFTW